jgi:hypothetical protein
VVLYLVLFICTYRFVETYVYCIYLLIHTCIQVMDLECENREGVTAKDLEWIHMHKTGALLKVDTLESCIRRPL